MRLLTIGLIVSLHYSMHYSEARNCILEGGKYNEGINIYTPEIDDNTDEFLTISTQYVKSVVAIPQDNNYVNVSYLDDKLTFTPSQEFKSNFEINTAYTLKPRVSVKIKLTCTDDDTYEIDYYQSINDVNTFPPVFSNPTYDFTIPMPIGGNVDLTIFGEAILATDYDVSNEGIDFEIQGESSDSLEVLWEGRITDSETKGKQHKGVLKTKSPLRLTKDTTYVITATDKGQPDTKSATANVNIKIDLSGSLPSSPSFETGFYQAVYDNSNPEKHSISNTPIKVSEGITTDDITLGGVYAQNFEHIIGIDGLLKISLTSNLPEDVIHLEPFVALSITASIEKAEVAATTSLIVTMPGKKTISFEKVFYEAKYFETEGEAQITEVLIDVTEGASVDVVGAYKEYFEYDNIKKSVKVIKALSLSDFKNWYIDVTIQATLGPAKAEAVLVVSPTAIIAFEGQLVFEGNPNDGITGQITAKSSISEDIIFSFAGDVLPELLQHLSLTDDGHLKSIELPPGFYEINVLAIGTISKASATTPVKILIGSAEICPDGTIFNAYSFQAFSVKENEAESIVLPLPAESGYYYEIIDIQPNKDRFELNARGDFVAKLLDRESDEFGSGKAQYIAKIKLVPNTEDMHFSSRSTLKTFFISKEETRVGDDKCYALDTIINEPNQIVVGISVEDVNDNEPTFEKAKIVVGYPEFDLLKTVSPPYLIIVKATDEDIGEYASLQYSVESSKVFIDANTGYIYPTDKIYENDEIIKVTATDEYGNGKKSKVLELTIKILEREHLCVLKYHDKHLEDLDSVMDSLARYADVRHLSAAVLPGTNPYSRDSNDRSLIITAYAFDIDSDNLLTAEELIERLEDIEGLFTEPFPDPGDNSCTTECPGGNDVECSKGGLIAAVIALAILSVLCIGGFIAFYILKFRKTKPYSQMEEENPKDVTKESAIENPKFTKHPAPVPPSTKSEVDLNERRPTGYFGPEDLLEEPPSSPPVAPPLEFFNNEMEGRPKSVVFNNNIEEIDIEREAEAEDEDTDKEVA